LDSQITVAHVAAEGVGMATKTDEVVGALGGKALEYLGALEALTKEYAPDVAEAGLNVTRFIGAQQLLYGGIGLLLLVVNVIVARAIWKSIDGESYDANDKRFAIFMVSLVVQIFCIAFLTYRLFVIWNYVAIFEPKLYIAYKIFEKVL
jgi:hypothetical protein